MEQNQKNELATIYALECDKLLIVFDKIIMDSDANDQLTDAAELFRVLHTLKGSSSMMEYKYLAELSHNFENILSKIKKESLSPQGKLLQKFIDTSIEFSAYFRTQLALIRDEKPIYENKKLDASMATLSENFSTSFTADVAVPNMATETKKTVKAGAVPRGVIRITVKLRKCPIPHIRAFIIAKSIRNLCSFVATVPNNIERASDSDNDILKNGFELQVLPLPETDIKTVTDKIASQTFVDSFSVAKVQDNTPSIAANVMVEQKKLNNLIYYMNELESVESAFEAFMEESGMNFGRGYELLLSLKHTLREVEILTFSIGTLSIDRVFMQMQIAIRNMSRELGKEIKVCLTGLDIMVDKSIIDILSDSLIHIVRNAADHGIELPAERKTAGKAQEGTIALSASKKNDYLTVTVTDDGRGISRSKVLDSAEKKGILDKPRDEYSDEEIYNLLLRKNLSTKNEITKYSGRGVGLDTVERRVKQVGGRVTLESHEKKGTTFTLKIPISLTVIDGIEILAVGGNRLVIPSNAVLHISVASKAEKTNDQIEYRGTMYSQLLFPGEKKNVNQSDGYILFLTADFGAYYLYANQIKSMTSYYVKALPECVSDKLEENNIYSGCVLCADSHLCCILDAEKLITISKQGNIREEFI